MDIPNIVGVIGTILLVGTYFMLAAQKIKGDSYPYLICNAVAAALILYSLCYHFNLASFIIEIFWISISVYGIWKKKTQPQA